MEYFPEEKSITSELGLALLIELTAEADHDKRNDYFKQIGEINKEMDTLKARRVTCEKTDNKTISLDDLPKVITEFDDNVIRHIIRGVRVLKKEKVEILF